MQIIVFVRNANELCSAGNAVDLCPVDFGQICIYLQIYFTVSFFSTWVCPLNSPLKLFFTYFLVLSLIMVLNKIYEICLFYISVL